MYLRDRLERRKAAYLAALFGHLIIGTGFVFLTRGSGGVFNIRRSTSSGVGIARFSVFMVEV